MRNWLRKVSTDYMQEGYLAALDAIELATGEREVNVIGYCLGGTLLAATLAWMAAKNDDRIKTATFFVTMMDFKEAGELGVFIDEEQLSALEEKMNKRGYLEGSEMATTFNMLRANDLIWSFVVNNYLLGNDPFPFDLLYWNAEFDPDAGENAQLLSAQDVSGKSAVRAGRDRAGRRADQSGENHHSGVFPFDTGRSYRAVEIDLSRDTAFGWAEAVRAGGVGTYRRRGQFARWREIQSLDQRGTAARS